MLNREHYPVLAVNAAVLLFFLFYFGARKNYEFLLYIGVIVFFLVVILLTNRRVRYPLSVLWGLTFWAFLHMAGGGFRVGDKVLYQVMLFPLSDEYPIVRFDQFVHIVGFGVATLLMYHLLSPLLDPARTRWTALSIVIVMAGLGVGALNEIVEFGATVLVPETGVGGYINTALDLVSDLVGAVLAVVYIRIVEGRKSLGPANSA